MEVRKNGGQVGDKIGNGVDGHIFITDMRGDFFRKAAVDVIFFQKINIFGVCRQGENVLNREREYLGKLDERDILARKYNRFGGVFRELACRDDNGFRTVDIFGISKEIFMRDHAVRE